MIEIDPLAFRDVITESMTSSSLSNLHWSGGSNLYIRPTLPAVRHRRSAAVLLTLMMHPLHPIAGWASIDLGVR